MRVNVAIWLQVEPCIRGGEEVNRREFIGVLAAYAGAALLGAIGGATAKESGEWSESGDEEPPI